MKFFKYSDPRSLRLSCQGFFSQNFECLFLEDWLVSRISLPLKGRRKLCTCYKLVYFQPLVIHFGTKVFEFFYSRERFCLLYRSRY
ncbi:unnamed protein product [Nezara viridula]|uniref:Uncharacterized protein n=1 Tax=Nezara viridula TaxID=85310 RepID=A0A9P0HBX5_NEZVI|nr:unnamed protein product [Nezara viridula]